MKVYIDGQLVDKSEAKISVFDHGLLYGDGIFEGIRIYNGRIFELDAHIKRLEDSARAICLELPMSLEEISQATVDTVAANGLRDGYIRLVVTRGAGGLGLNPYLCEKASVIIIADTIKLYPEEFYQNGLDIITCATRRPTPASLSPQVKSLNYLNNVMAKIEAIQAGTLEALMLNEQGYVAECTGDNVFVVRDGVIFTPSISAGALDGITRRTIMKLAVESGYEVREVYMSRYEIFTADECFLTGTAAEVIPVVSLDKRTIGSGQPGEITRELIAKYRALVAESGTPVGV
ncbi:branched-chain-amino-acid transaminase [Sulfuriroseicoccus oceanibius]|uniref:Branched-chain-amino-acid aminotransferase n=1 Tax=Sulfuriroseicoccus oceanibius TaxID=2707525 RepID=A0A6B3LEV2_9BACT|nr:branched-chain-amino-acid transaminase [Sulfuriroseicoccus oceanibius]QQL44897.1 branched-chain-amino-acid transaminase [Sulfuriroseicoccus oceanibius]